MFQQVKTRDHSDCNDQGQVRKTKRNTFIIKKPNKNIINLKNRLNIKVLLYSTGNDIQYLIITYNGN